MNPTPPGRLLPAPRGGAAPVSARPPAGGSALDEENFARDLGLMLRSGLSMLDALSVAGERAGSGAANIFSPLLGRLQEGESLSSAMRGSGHFGPGIVACVKAGEGTGDLGESLHRFAGHAARLRAIRARLVSALVYPALLIAVAMLVVLFLLSYVVPKFALVLESSHQELPLLSLWLVRTGGLLNQHQVLFWSVLLGLGAAGAVWLWRAVRSRRLWPALTSALGRVPGLGPTIRVFALSQFTRSAAMLVRSGVPALQSLAMSRDLLITADCLALDRALAAAATGFPLAQSLHRQAIVDSLGERILRVAEQTGQLELALDRLADVHDAALERLLDRAGRLIEPVVMMGIGLVVGGIVVLMYLPIFQLASSVQ